MEERSSSEEDAVEMEEDEAEESGEDFLVRDFLEPPILLLTVILAAVKSFRISLNDYAK